MRILLLLAASAVTIQGQDFGRGGEGRGRRPGAMRMDPILSALDTDHDGVISAAEIDNAPAALRKLDKNGDGQITADEVRPVFEGEGRERGGRGRENREPDPSEQLVQTLMAFDKNNDGKISRDELPERMQGLMDRGDTNKDGFLSAEEIRALARAQAAENTEVAAPEREERREGPPRPNMVFAALDTNHDGVVSADEIAHAAAALRTLDKNADGQLTEDEVRPQGFGRGRGRQ